MPANTAPFIRRLPTGNGQYIRIGLERLRMDHCHWWHRNVQPLINKGPKGHADISMSWTWTH